MKHIKDIILNVKWARLQMELGNHLYLNVINIESRRQCRVIYYSFISLEGKIIKCTYNDSYMLFLCQHIPPKYTDKHSTIHNDNSTTGYILEYFGVSPYNKDAVKIYLMHFHDIQILPKDEQLKYKIMYNI